jgi:hypothetical protein
MDDSKARKKAAKAGINVDGAVFVDRSLSKDSHWQTLAVFPDRIEFVDHGKVGTFTRKGAGMEAWRYDRITAVSATKAGAIYSNVNIVGPGATLQFRTAHVLASHLRSVIQEGIDSAQLHQHAAPPQISSDADEIRKLAELRDSGILTEDEFSAKKAQILGL